MPGAEGKEKWGEMCQRVQTSSYIKNKFLEFDVQHGDYTVVNNTCGIVYWKVADSGT